MSQVLPFLDVLNVDIHGENIKLFKIISNSNKDNIKSYLIYRERVVSRICSWPFFSKNKSKQ